MPIADQDHGGVPMPVPASLPGGSHQAFDLGPGQIFAMAVPSSVSIHAARYSPSLSLWRHTQPLPARRTFFAPIERSARAWLTICVAVGRRPAWTISGRAHSVSIGVVASPSWALKQNLTPRCNRPPSAGPRQRGRLFNLAIFLHFFGLERRIQLQPHQSWRQNRPLRSSQSFSLRHQTHSARLGRSRSPLWPPRRPVHRSRFYGVLSNVRYSFFLFDQSVMAVTDSLSVPP